MVWGLGPSDFVFRTGGLWVRVCQSEVSGRKATDFEGRQTTGEQRDRGNGRVRWPPL